MRHGNTAGLLGIIIKVSLCVLIRIVTDNLDGVLVCSNGSVSSQSPELTVYGSCRSRNDGRPNLQRKMGYIIIDSDSKSLLILVVVYSYNLCGSSVLGT